MRFGSVCSGIEAASVAWEPLSWRAAWFAEIAPFPSRVLAHRFPETPNHGDFTKIEARPGDIDLLVGGTPCQSFSIAGLRGGLGDSRGNLALEFVRLAERARPRWIVWENVPGVLSSGGGRDFGSILGALGELGYGFAYRVLDAQFFGVPQRRRRVFVVGCLGDWRPPAAVLFEPPRLRWDSEASEASRGGSAASTRTGADSLRGLESEAGRAVAKTLTAHEGGRRDALTENLVPVGGGFDAVSIAENQRGEVVTSPVTQALSRGGGKPGQGYPAIAFHHTQDPISGDVSPCLSRMVDGMGVMQSVDLRNASLGAEVCGTLEAGQSKGNKGQGVLDAFAVRRLTPRECERLQGFPDDWTAIPGAADGPRYRALGNSMAVPVMRWIGRRIAIADAAIQRGAV